MKGKVLSVGKFRGLSATSSADKVFTILAFDHRHSFLRMLKPTPKEGEEYQAVVTAKSDLVPILSPYGSAILLDPVYSAAQMIISGRLPGDIGLLVSAEASGYTGDNTGRVSKILENWGVEKIKRMGANAVKLLIYYHPDAGKVAEEQEKLVSKVVEDCRKHDIPLFVEAVSYSIDPRIDKKSQEFAAGHPDVVVETARRLGPLGPEILKLEFPVQPEFDSDESHWLEACQAVSEASPAPWAVLTGGVTYDVFVEQLEIACKGGASGFLAGRAVWQESMSMSRDERRDWLEKVAVQRLQELAAIAEDFARPWTDFYPPQDVADYENWYASYKKE
jgi:tagatose 1,6-diphosphate aldolase